MEFLVPEVKRQKLIENGNVGNGMELNDLPEGILLDILSLLPIKEAIKTSVLSRRWRHLWTHMPRLVIEHVTVDKIKAARFMNLVDRAFIHRGSSSIESFSVGFGLRDDKIEYRVRTWIMGTVRHKVQKLSIACPLASVPFCVFMCKTLIELNLSGPTLKLPSSVCLPSLKVLSFKDIKFVDSLSMEKLFSIPNLEELAFCGCNWKDLAQLNISSPKLRKLSISNCNPHSTGCRNFQVLINGGNLKCFEFAGRLDYDICISAASLLDTATIEIYNIYFGEQFGYHVHKLLMGLISTKALSIAFVAIEALYKKSKLLDTLPLFCNLRKLKIQGQRFNFDCQAPLAILTKFPYLETLIFHKGIKLTKGQKNFKSIFKPSPLCFSSELKYITIREFECGREQMIFPVNLLRDRVTKVLKEMVIQCSQLFWQRQIWEDVVVNVLKALCKRSEDCCIIFRTR